VKLLLHPQFSVSQIWDLLKILANEIFTKMLSKHIGNTPIEKCIRLFSDNTQGTVIAGSTSLNFYFSLTISRLILLNININYMKFNIRLYCCTLFLSFIVFGVNAQSIQIQGKVSKKLTGEPLSGAIVSIKGTKTSILSDESGNLNCSASKGQYYIGFLCRHGNY